jgi:predicted nucleotidyltransferase
MTDFESALRALVDSGVQFIVVGAYAAFAHGSNQLTHDLDICYERTTENMRRLASALAPHRPRLRGIPEQVPFIFDERTLSQGMNFTLDTDMGEIDLLGELSGIGQFPELIKDTQIVGLHGRTIRIASLDAIIRSKQAAGREKDRAILPELEALKELLQQDKKKEP